MKALFNNQILEDQLFLPFNDRALQFGDGLFETIIVTNNFMPLLSYHMRRLKKGAKCLRLDLPKPDKIENSIQRVLEANGLNKYARVKLQVWRKENPSTGYSISTSDTNMFISAVDFQPDKNLKKGNVSFSEEVSLHYSKYSRFKTTNGLAYIYASIERDEKGFDDLILMDREGNISECISSNIFWVKDNIYYTPSLRSGCVEGVMRNYVIDQLKESGVSLKKQLVKKHELLEADAVFSTNVTGVSVITSIDGHAFSPILELPF